MIYHRGTLEKISGRRYRFETAKSQPFFFIGTGTKKQQNCEHEKPFFDLFSAYFYINFFFFNEDEWNKSAFFN